MEKDWNKIACDWLNEVVPGMPAQERVAEIKTTVERNSQAGQEREAMLDYLESNLTGGLSAQERTAIARPWVDALSDAEVRPRFMKHPDQAKWGNGSDR
jgi:hypothetical protein